VVVGRLASGLRPSAALVPGKRLASSCVNSRHACAAHRANWPKVLRRVAATPGYFSSQSEPPIPHGSVNGDLLIAPKARWPAPESAVATRAAARTNME